MAAKWNREGLTDKQQAELEPLMKRAAIFKRKIDEKARLMMIDIGMDFDKKNEICRQKKELEKSFNKINAEIEEVYTAKERYEEKIKMATKCIEEAEALQNRYGVKIH